jgi:transketolase
VAAAKLLGGGIRVVSAPCLERFDRQDGTYREEVLPSTCRKRVSIEAGVTEFWYKYIGLDGKPIGIDRFGLSAPGGTVMKELGITADHVVQVVKSLLGVGVAIS